MSDADVEITGLAVNVVIPERLRWTDTRGDQTYVLQTLNVRLLRDGHLAAKAYGRPLEGRGNAYAAFRVPDTPALTALISSAADGAAARWADRQGPA